MRDQRETARGQIPQGEGSEERGAELHFQIFLEAREKIRWLLEGLPWPDSSLQAFSGASPNQNLRQAGDSRWGCPLLAATGITRG